ncbi:hypothetical protein BPOR_0818g00020 [Botrytis porri]|uniref:Uncharacterized protein n=1 Tax=Botrytis porri TaxID=87229 RepID=A0A4Z1KAS1_9HELO|nr:hypothetical protein BPOR_0818g00020 [Botrytis porri]
MAQLYQDAGANSLSVSKEISRYRVFVHNNGYEIQEKTMSSRLSVVKG